MLLSRVNIYSDAVLLKQKITGMLRGRYDESRALHRKGAETTKKKKEAIWSQRKKRFHALRAQGLNKTDACLQLQVDEIKSGRKVSHKTLMRKLKD